MLISIVTDLSIKNIFEITDEIRGNESPRPTPAAHIIAPIKNISNNAFKKIFLIFNIPEKVKFEFGFLCKAKLNATTGRQ